ncbi:MAG: type II toxin-antitoxin system VapC family toxin [Alphaproteobacteria bacterium]|nr:type II toxin-antitoxin system VapC family toxin [Alphaproteobacteria bacterium]
MEGASRRRAPVNGFVLDASATAGWLFDDEKTMAGDALLASLRESSAMVPAIWPLEIANLLVSGERRGRISPERVERQLATLSTLPIHVDPETCDRAWDEILALARAHRLTVYDAAYLELALRLGLPLATRDGDLAVAARAAGVEVMAV